MTKPAKLELVRSPLDKETAEMLKQIRAQRPYLSMDEWGDRGVPRSTIAVLWGRKAVRMEGDRDEEGDYLGTAKVVPFEVSFGLPKPPKKNPPRAVRVAPQGGLPLEAPPAPPVFRSATVGPVLGGQGGPNWFKIRQGIAEAKAKLEADKTAKGGGVEKADEAEEPSRE